MLFNERRIVQGYIEGDPAIGMLKKEKKEKDPCHKPPCQIGFLQILSLLIAHDLNREVPEYLLF